MILTASEEASRDLVLLEERTKGLMPSQTTEAVLPHQRVRASFDALLSDLLERGVELGIPRRTVELRAFVGAVGELSDALAEGS